MLGSLFRNHICKKNAGFLIWKSHYGILNGDHHCVKNFHVYIFFSLLIFVEKYKSLEL